MSLRMDVRVLNGMQIYCNMLGFPLIGWVMEGCWRFNKTFHIEIVSAMHACMLCIFFFTKKQKKVSLVFGHLGRIPESWESGKIKKKWVRKWMWGIARGWWGGRGLFGVCLRKGNERFRNIFLAGCRFNVWPLATFDNQDTINPNQCWHDYLYHCNLSGPNLRNLPTGWLLCSTVPVLFRSFRIFARTLCSVHFSPHAIISSPDLERW